MTMQRIGTRRVTAIDVRRGGFSLIELLTTMSIIGILAAVAMPNFRNAVVHARAVEVASDFEVVKVATVSFNADMHAWPPDATLGTVPAELTSYVPEGFSFQGDGYELKFENYTLAGGLPFDASTTQLIAVSVTADDDRLSNAIISLLRSSLVFSVGRTHTVVIDRS